MKELSIELPENQKILIREAIKTDVDDVWRWRNDKIARANSLDPRRISFQEHKTWFVNQLKKPNSKIYLATKSRKKIGMVRFDFLADDKVEISININPRYRGKGFGKRVLRAMSDLIKDRYTGRTQKAIIKTSNVASERIFAAADFIKVYEIDNPGYSVWVKNLLPVRRMRVLFLGNNWLGWKVAEWLRQQNEEIVGLILHPPSKRKFGNEIIASAKVDSAHIFNGSELKKPEVINSIKKLAPDTGVSVFFGYILDQKFLDLFQFGCVNVHTAFLPYNRGAHPNVWSIIDKTMAGVTIHYMDAGVDTGPIIARQQLSVMPTDTGASLYRRLECLAFDLFKKVWPLIHLGLAPGVPQRTTEGSYHMLHDLDRIDKIDLDQTYSARKLIDIVRARTFPPHAGAYYEQNGRKIYLRLQLFEEEELKKQKKHEHIHKN